MVPFVLRDEVTQVFSDHNHVIMLQSCDSQVTSGLIYPYPCSFPFSWYPFTILFYKMFFLLLVPILFFTAVDTHQNEGSVSCVTDLCIPRCMALEYSVCNPAIHCLIVVSAAASDMLLFSG